MIVMRSCGAVSWTSPLAVRGLSRGGSGMLRGLGVNRGHLRVRARPRFAPPCPPQSFDMKPTDNRAWFLVLPALVIVTFVGVLPLIAVTNYSFQDLFSLTNPYWVGGDWYR